MRRIVYFLSVLLTLTLATSRAADPILLFNSGSLSGSRGSDQYFQFTVPPGLLSVTLEIFTYPGAYGSGRAAASYNTYPSDAALNSGNPTGYNPPAGTYFARVHGDSYFRGIGVRILGTPPPFYSVAGTFASVVDGTNYVRFTVNTMGAFSGVFLLDRVAIPFKGRFDSNGNAASIQPVPFSLHLDPDPSTDGLGANVVTGTVAGHTVAAYHTAYRATSNARETGSYTVLLSPTQTGATIPSGIGFASLRVARNGNSTMVGKLPDGTSFTSSGPLFGAPGKKRQFLLLSTAVYANKGLIASPIVFEALPGNNCTSSLRWLKPVTASTVYPGSIDTTLALTGNLYGSRLRGLPAVDFTPGLNNITLNLSGGGLATNISEAATFSILNTVTLSGANPSNIRVAVNSATGIFRGLFAPVPGGADVPFTGMLYQNANTPRAAGYFLNGTQGGAITIDPH